MSETYAAPPASHKQRALKRAPLFVAADSNPNPGRQTAPTLRSAPKHVTRPPICGSCLSCQDTFRDGHMVDGPRAAEITGNAAPWAMFSVTRHIDDAPSVPLLQFSAAT